jgi:hypothetical protein
VEGTAPAIPADPNSPLLRVVQEDDNHRVELLCPKCETWADVLAFKNPDMVRKYAAALNPILKCMNCKHLFSPRWLATEE